MLAALEEEENDGDKLMDAARRLAGAFTSLLKAAQPGSQEVCIGACFHHVNIQQHLSLVYVSDVCCHSNSVDC